MVADVRWSAVRRRRECTQSGAVAVPSPRVELCHTIHDEHFSGGHVFALAAGDTGDTAGVRCWLLLGGGWLLIYFG